MKRMLVLTIALLLLFCSCQKDTDTPPDDESEVLPSVFETYAVNNLNGEFSASAAENPWASASDQKDESLPQEKSFTLFGKAYTATYQYSEIDNKESYATAYYETEDLISFGFHPDTGSIVFADFRNKKFFEDDPRLPTLEDPQKYAVEKASELAAQWIDVSAYEQSVSFDDRSKTIDGVEYEWTRYFVHFFKSVGGIKTSDYLSISFTSKGTLALITMGDLGAFSNFEDANCTTEAIKDSINAVMQKMQKEKNREEQAFEIEEHFLALTPDGEYVVCSTLSVTYRDAQTKKNYQGGVTLITKFGERATE